MAKKKIKPDTDLGNAGSPDFDDLQEKTKNADFESDLKQIRDEVPTRSPNKDFLRQFEIVDLGNDLANMYAYMDNEWKMLGGGLINVDQSTTTVQNTTTETNLTKFTLKKNALNRNGELTVEIPVEELDLLNSSSSDEITISLYLDSTKINSETVANPTGSDINNDSGHIKAKIINDGSKTSQRSVINFLSSKYRLTNFSTSSVDTTKERTVKVTAQFEGASSSNKLKVGNSTARIIA